MPDALSPMSPAGERVLAAAMTAGMLVILEVGLALLGAPAVALPWPALIALAAVALVRRDIVDVRRHGWWLRGAGGSGDRSPDGMPPEGPADGRDQLAWERFEEEFWQHVESERSTLAR